MAKYHITKDGTPALCRASKRACPLGSEDEHYGSLPEAEAAIFQRDMDAFASGHLTDEAMDEQAEWLAAGQADLEDLLPEGGLPWETFTSAAEHGLGLSEGEVHDLVDAPGSPVEVEPDGWVVPHGARS